MILLLDAGNTRLKWALWQQGQWLERGAWSNAALPQKPERWHAVSAAVVCHVGSPAVRQWLQQQLSAVPVVHWVSAQPHAAGIINDYADPSQLGADRWAALVAVRSMTREAALVINAGTAVTVDALTADGHFVGGIIVPGLYAMRLGLSGQVARLPERGGEWRVFPDNTLDGLYTGAVQAAAGAIDLQWRALADLSGQSPQCYLAGGDAPALLPRLSHLPVHLHEDLVLQGLLQLQQLKEA